MNGVSEVLQALLVLHAAGHRHNSNTVPNGFGHGNCT